MSDSVLRLGVTSRIIPTPGVKSMWAATSTLEFPLPVIVDHMFVDPDTHEVGWHIEATVDLIDQTPALTALTIRTPGGADIVRLQREFRWASPLDIVMMIVPHLLERGIDPFAYDYPVEDFPRSAELDDTTTARLDDEFLETVAREYLALGRGYAKKMAVHYSVSPRTVVSWIEKARRRGILTAVRQGSRGGEIVPRAKRSTVHDPFEE